MGGGVKRLVGVGLLGIEGVQLGVMVTGLASSRASFAPTVLIAARRNFAYGIKILWERACSRRRWVSHIFGD